MIGVFVNCLSIIAGCGIGLLFKKLINQNIAKSILKVLGVVVIITGVTGILKSMLVINSDGSIDSKLDLFLLIIVIFGLLLGELLKIDDSLNKFGLFLEKKIKIGKISEGFINASIIFVVGAMSIMGSINAGLGDYNILYLKSALDGITSIILSTTLGIGVGLAFIPVLIFQGLIVILTIAFGSFIPTDFITSFNLIGYFIVVCIGLNFLINDKIKIANLLPSLLLVVLYYLVI